MHELATNAAKYGALSMSTGSLHVEWRIAEDGDVVLQWRESGGPPAAPPARRGFGSTLIRNSIKEQLGGRLALNWKSEGLTLEMRIPARHWTRQEASTRVVPAVAMVQGAAPKRVLVVEDSALIAMEIEQILRDLGCDVVGPALTLDNARLLAEAPDLDAVVLDLNLHGESSLPLAENLRSRAIPVLLCSGYEEMWEAAWADAPRLKKPFSRADLIAGLHAIVQARDNC
jgi:CheY-like chemotaxis protein